ncbi:TetR/AcrR family transcriptional regulator [Thalassospira alkalitolerans]|uniref:TetR/AcrR family transcriptional regulator n=1 Tax=Thalassospira alkalitolerans TaxID=1293890 RepID=UPI003AA7E36B
MPPQSPPEKQPDFRPVKQRINRIEKRQKREEMILERAGELIAEYGFFELKMSDLARECEISVGTLYVHFASKEDLLLGLAIMAGQKRAVFFDHARAHDGSAMEKFIVASLLDIRFSIEHPQLFEAEYLALAPSIWKRATPSHHQSQLAGIGRITEMFQSFLSDAAAELGISDQEIARTRSLNLGSWGLSFGMNALVLSEITDRHYGAELRGNAIDIFCDSLADLLFGAGWHEDNARQIVHDLAQRYADHQP